MIFKFLIIVIGLAIFEVITSIDNAIVNAHILKTVPEKFRKFFLLWGLLIAVLRLGSLIILENFKKNHTFL